MTDIPPVPKITTTAEFYAQALAIEVEACERYGLLADQMEVHNNAEVAAIFRKMVQVESLHRDEIERRAGNKLVGGLPATFSWIGPDGPESTAFETVHYLMSPHHALQIAKLNEERAARWFVAIAASATDPEIKETAVEFARDEHEHVRWVDEWLKKYPPPPEGWDEDDDPPVFSD